MKENPSKWFTLIDKCIPSNVGLLRATSHALRFHSRQWSGRRNDGGDETLLTQRHNGKNQR